MILKVLILKILNIVLVISLSTLVSFSIISCTFIDDYFVRKQVYDDLRSDYNDISMEYTKQSGELELLKEEKEYLKNEISNKNKEILAREEEILALKEKLDSTDIKDLEEKIERLSKEPEKLRKLLDNINKLLKYVYIGSSAPEEILYTFTAFSIEYKGKYYIITAGHCVKDNYGKEGTFKFKANFSNEWIYPELLGYNTDFWELDDYAVFYSDNINGGLSVGELKTPENYLLGSLDKSLSVFRNLGGSSRRGESGSPVINEEMEVIGIYVVYGYIFTPIQLALDVIDNSVMN